MRQSSAGGPCCDGNLLERSSARRRRRFALGCGSRLRRSPSIVSAFFQYGVAESLVRAPSIGRRRVHLPSSLAAENPCADRRSAPGSAGEHVMAFAAGVSGRTEGSCRRHTTNGGAVQASSALTPKDISCTTSQYDLSKDISHMQEHTKCTDIASLTVENGAPDAIGAAGS